MTTTHRIILKGSAPSGASAQAEQQLDDYIERTQEIAIEEAHAAGEAAGRASALEGAAAALEQTAAALEEQRAECVEEVTSLAVELGIGIARSLVRAELAAARHDIEAIVRDVLSSAGSGRTTTKIYVSPEDADRLNEISFRAATEVVSDEAVSTGSVRVETPQGVLVRDIDQCMESVIARLNKEVIQ